jgi:excisionase family DNA binding protein
LLHETRARAGDVPEPAFLTVSQVARLLGVSPPIVYRFCELGELVHVRVSNAIRIGLADLADYVDRHKRYR